MLTLRGLNGTPSFSRDFNDIFDLARFPSGVMNGLTNFQPFQENALRMDVRENPDSYEAVFDVPGIPKEHVKISYEADTKTLTVSVDHKEERHGTTNEKGKGKGKDSKGNVVHWKERSSGFASRSVTMPDNCDFDKAAATQEDGVLKIVFPKNKELEKKKYIDIK